MNYPKNLFPSLDEEEEQVNIAGRKEILNKLSAALSKRDAKRVSAYEEINDSSG
jgi:malonyl CoA-acyl carrier protein transacylase